MGKNLENILTKKKPEYLKEWDFEKNDSLGFSIEKLTTGSNEKVWWKCTNGHEWITSIKSRTNGSLCPYCTGTKLLPGYNDFATKKPELLSEWDYQKNTIEPSSISANNHKKVWWKCNICGHSWQAEISNRTMGSGCPICGRKKVNEKNSTAAYKNSIAYLYPELMKEWDYERNNGINPNTIYPQTSRKAWWICQQCKQHYYAIISNRVHGSNCPICAGKVVIEGVNDLKTWCENNNQIYLLDEWDYDRNEISPSQIAPFANRKVWFICKEGHSYKASLANRTSNHTGCPTCIRHYRTSFQEQAIFYYLKSIYPNTINSYHAEWLGQLELDIFIPDLSTAIEYDGVVWHTNKQNDQKKTLLCSSNGIRLIRVREVGLEESENCINIYIDPNKRGSIDNAIKELFHILGIINVDISVDNDTPLIVEQFDLNRKNNSIASKAPHLLAEWNYEKNRHIDPDYVSYGSDRKFWWTCPLCGKDYLMSTTARTNLKQGCPNCSSKKKADSFRKTILLSRISFSDSGSPLLEEWDYERNNISPSEITPGSKKKVWWKCKKCHNSWEDNLQNRTIAGYGCPYCSGKRILQGFNDLGTKNPDLLKEWDYEKNSNLGIDPTTISPGSKLKAWWKCSKCNNIWVSSVQSRTSGKGCPYCSHRKVLRGYNDLATTSPDLMTEWDYQKNNDLGISPYNVSRYSHIKVWWKCPNCNNNWVASIENRSKGTKCPQCSHKKLAIANCKKVKCDETGIVFDSIRDAAKWANVTEGALVTHLKGKTNNSAGFHWHYIDDDF